MNIYYHRQFLKSLSEFPDSVKKKLKKQLVYLMRDIRHPSLHSKKYDEAQDIWQARVDKEVRFYFSIEGDTYSLLDIKNHPK